MIKILLSGCSGKMGAAVINLAGEDNDVEIIAGVDSVNRKLPFPVFSGFKDVTVTPDVIIDFSNVSVLDNMLSFAAKHKTPAVIATT